MFFGKDIVKNALQVSSWEKLCIIIKNESVGVAVKRYPKSKVRETQVRW